LSKAGSFTLRHRVRIQEQQILLPADHIASLRVNDESPRYRDSGRDVSTQRVLDEVLLVMAVRERDAFSLGRRARPRHGEQSSPDGRE
jgi:hypothetical protein